MAIGIQKIGPGGGELTAQDALQVLLEMEAGIRHVGVCFCCDLQQRLAPDRETIDGTARYA